MKLKKKQGFAGQRMIELPKDIIQRLLKHYPSAINGYFTKIGFYPDAKYQFIEDEKGREEYILIYCINGYGSAKIHQRTYHISPGDFFIIPSNSPFSYHADELKPWSIFWFYFRGEAIEEIANRFLRTNQTHKGFLAYHEERVKLFNLIYQNLERGYGLENMSTLNMCLLNLVSTLVLTFPNHKRKEHKKQSVVGSSILLMKEQVEQNLTLKYLADNANMSVSHFSAVFKNQTGMAPLVYFNNLKMQKGIEYLKFTDYLIKEIAFKLGFADAQYFTRLFTKTMGKSPKMFRKEEEA